MNDTKIVGDNNIVLSVKEAFYSSKARSLNSNSKSGTVVLCVVDEGVIKTGQKVVIQIDGQEIEDRILRIETNRIPKKVAGVGEEIGVCLQTNKPQLFGPLFTERRKKKHIS